MQHCNFQILYFFFGFRKLFSSDQIPTKKKLLTSSSEQDTPHKKAGKSHMKVRLIHCSSCFLARNKSSKCQILTKPPKKATIKPRPTNSSSSNTCIIITTISQTISHYTPQHESIHQLSCSDLPYHVKKGQKG